MMTTENWKKKREEQGLSYAEIVKEIKRRAAGNYLFSKKENAERLRRALHNAELLFKFSAHLSDFLETEQVTVEDLAGVFDDSDTKQGLLFSLDPIPRNEKKDSIFTDPLIDYLYPGKDFEVERSDSHFYIKRKAK